MHKLIVPLVIQYYKISNSPVATLILSAMTA